MNKIFQSVRFWVSVSAVLIAALFVLTTWIIWEKPNKWSGMGQELELSKQQVEILKNIYAESREGHKKARLEIRNIESDFQKNMSDPKKSVQDLTEQFSQLDLLKSKMARSQFNMTLKIREVIGAEKMKKIRNNQFGRAKPPRPPRPPPMDHRDEN